MVKMMYRTSTHMMFAFAAASAAAASNLLVVEGSDGSHATAMSSGQSPKELPRELPRELSPLLLQEGEGTRLTLGASFTLDNYIQPRDEAAMAALISDLEFEISAAIRSTEYDIYGVNILHIGDSQRNRNLRNNRNNRNLVTLTSPVTYEVIIQRVCSMGACDQVPDLPTILYEALTNNLWDKCDKWLKQVEAGSQNPNLADAIISNCDIDLQDDEHFTALVYRHAPRGSGDCGQASGVAAEVSDATAGDGTPLHLYDRLEMVSAYHTDFPDNEWACGRECDTMATLTYDIGYRGFHFEAASQTCSCLWDDGLLPTADAFGTPFDACDVGPRTPWCVTDGYQADGTVDILADTLSGQCYETDTPLKHFTKMSTPGRCQDQFQHKYDYAMFQNIGLVDHCAEKCLDTAVFYSREVHLTSFTFGVARGRTLCYCEFNDEQVPEMEREVASVNPNQIGRGEVFSTDIDMRDAEDHFCYSYDYYRLSVPAY